MCAVLLWRFQNKFSCVIFFFFSQFFFSLFFHDILVFLPLVSVLSSHALACAHPSYPSTCADHKQLYSISASSNLTVKNPGNDHSPCYSPDGRYLLYLSMARAQFESDRNRLMLVDRSTHETRELAGAWPFSTSAVSWSPDSSALYLTGMSLCLLCFVCVRVCVCVCACVRACVCVCLCWGERKKGESASYEPPIEGCINCCPQPNRLAVFKCSALLLRLQVCNCVSNRRLSTHLSVYLHIQLCNYYLPI